ncbi:hypothetical protein [Mycobacterium sp. SMC-13]|uniref:hypothetical protein n=1 Tax=Mycobacterium sp. SMC-13 TaxID=3381626 RepID=UPI003876C0AD
MTENHDAPDPAGAIDTSARPAWHRTGHKHFPYAAHQSGVWWVLRRNFEFPEIDMFTLFVDGLAAADVTAGPNDPVPLVASIGALDAARPEEAIPMLDEDTAATVVSTVAGYAEYGSEHDNHGQSDD